MELGKSLRAGEAEIAADLSPVVEGAVEHLVDQHRRTALAEALELHQLGDLGRRGARGCRLDRGAPGRLDGGDLLGDEQQPPVLASQLLAKVRRQRRTVGTAQFLEVRGEVGAQRAGLVNALGVQQRLDPVDVGAALLQQALALAAHPLGVLLGHRGHAHHAAHARLAPAMSEQHPHQLLEIQPVGLHPTEAAVDLDAGRIEHVVDDAARHQPAMQPEPFVAGLVAAHQPHRPALPSGGLRPSPVQARRQRCRVAASDHEAAHLRRARQHDAELPLRLAQFKGHEHRAMLRRGGGCVSAIECHLDPPGGGLVQAETTQ